MKGCINGHTVSKLKQWIKTPQHYSYFNSRGPNKKILECIWSGTKYVHCTKNITLIPEKTTTSTKLAQRNRLTIPVIVRKITFWRTEWNCTWFVRWTTPHKQNHNISKVNVKTKLLILWHTKGTYYINVLTHRVST